MNPDPQREDALFKAAAKLSGRERAVFLDGACHGDPGLRTQLDSLLPAHEQPKGAIASAPPEAAATVKVESVEDFQDEAVGFICAS